MITLISSFGGPFSTMGIIYFQRMVEMLFCLVFYTGGFHRRNRLSLRVTGGFFCCLALMFFLAVLRTLFPSVLTSILLSFLLYAIMYGYLALCFEEQTSELLLCLCAGIATQMVIGRLYEYLLVLGGQNEYQSVSPFRGTSTELDWLVFFLIHLVLALLLSLPFRRKDPPERGDESSRLVVAFSVSITVVTTIVTTVSRSFEGESPAMDLIIKIFAILYGVLVLVLRTGILEHGKAKVEIRLMDELLYAEKHHFERLQNDMSLINRRCHDLLHQLAGLSGKLTAQEVSSLESALQFFNADVKTGNDIMDLVLAQKQLYCEEHRIHLSCIADGQCVAALPKSLLYSLFSNAVGNALEAVAQVEPPEKRLVSITVGLKNALVAIHVTNYFAPEAAAPEENAHAYGLKSMQYLVQSYQGNLTYRTEGELFYLSIYLPVE